MFDSILLEYLLFSSRNDHFLDNSRINGLMTQTEENFHYWAGLINLGDYSYIIVCDNENIRYAEGCH